MRDLSSRGKGNSRVMKLLGRLSYEIIRRYHNSPPYMMARWPPQQIPPLDFLGMNQHHTKMSLLPISIGSTYSVHECLQIHSSIWQRWAHHDSSITYILCPLSSLNAISLLMSTEDWPNLSWAAMADVVIL